MGKIIVFVFILSAIISFWDHIWPTLLSILFVIGLFSPNKKKKKKGLYETTFDIIKKEEEETLQRIRSQSRN